MIENFDTFIVKAKTTALKTVSDVKSQIQLIQNPHRDHKIGVYELNLLLLNLDSIISDIKP